MYYPETVFSHDDEHRIIEAIRAFERRTSGEIRVHIEHRLRRPPVDEAVRVFADLGMDETAERNGVLFLLAPAQRCFAVIGDEGIDAVVPEDFWEQVYEEVLPLLRTGKLADALVAGIGRAGEALATFFPRQRDDINELPDEISYG